MFLKITLATMWEINCTAKVEVMKPFRGPVKKSKGRWEYLGLNIIAVEVLGSGRIENVFECKINILLDS